MRKVTIGLASILIPALTGVALSGCGEDNPLDAASDGVCGPCGTIAQGDVGISGDVRLDGFFKALGTMNNATAAIKADFDANIRALAAAYDVTLTGEINAAAVAQVTAAIRADVTANVSGGLQVSYQPARCQASLNVAVEAQARCEVKGGCDAQVDPGNISVSCEGQCSGGCEGSCEGMFSCEIEAPSIECSGRCEGSCTFEAAAECSGTCRGECTGTCSARDGAGNCAGQCDGTCEGTCEFAAAAECSGTCTGKCLVNQGTAQCSAQASCRGSCDGQCSGSCQGNVTPPSASVDCDVAADCQASAKAEAQASLECTPPQLAVDFAFNATAAADVEAQAAFSGRLTVLKARGIAILQGAAKYEALLTGKIEGETVFDPSPLAELRTSLTGFANANAIARFDIPAGRITCVVPAFQEAVSLAGNLATGTTATLQAQASFVSAFKGGFSS
jgi:modification target Cys-rich repeat protein